MLSHIVGDFSGMPELMKRLALVQFFSCSALFIMWINTTPVVAQEFFGATGPGTPAFQKGVSWVDVLFATYNGVAAVAALTLLPFLARRIARVRTHMIALLCGAVGYASFFMLRDPRMLSLSEIGIGIAWASILAMPYAILASALPQRKLGAVQRLCRGAAAAGGNGYGINHEGLFSGSADRDDGVCRRRHGNGRACDVACRRGQITWSAAPETLERVLGARVSHVGQCQPQ